MKNIFQENNYVVVEEAISKDLANFIKEYFLLKRKCVQAMLRERVISPYVEYLGTWNDRQMPDSYSHYADFAMETLLKGLKNKMEEITGTALYENYSYARIYKYGDELLRHKDRFSCEISSTLNLGGDPWPIYLDPTEGTNNEGIEVLLRPGEMLVYKGNKLEHWRYPFFGRECIQVFLHYNSKNTPGSEENKYDKREFLGLPACFQKQ